MSRISIGTARWLFWGLLLVLPSVCFVLLVVVTSEWMWLAGIPVAFLVVGGPGEHLFRALLRRVDVSMPGGDRSRDDG